MKNTRALRIPFGSQRTAVRTNCQICNFELLCTATVYQKGKTSWSAVGVLQCVKVR
jgi:hypothetical protein